jgi:hypothetical protein
MIFGSEDPADPEKTTRVLKPSIQLDEEPTITVREPDAATHLPPQYEQLMSERSVFCLKSALRT